MDLSYICEGENILKNIVFYGHGGSNNHGCEAIVQATQRIIDAKNAKVHYTLSTLDREADERFLTNIDRYIENCFIQDNSLQRYIAAISYKIFNKPEVSAKFMYKNFFDNIKSIDKNSIFISIGGDNYCCTNPAWLYLHNHAIDKIGSRRILWGCSVESETMSEKMVKDLSGYSLIVTRESITYKALVDKKVKSEIKLYPDPAFVLDIDTSKVPDYLKNNKTIGINLSPLIIGCGKEKNIVYNNYYKLVEHILKTTDYNVAFIPHVLIKGNNDYDSMESLYEGFRESKRVFIVDNSFSASQYKGIISKCSMFIGARTHSTIAAYSTCVPTLVVGYSVKAWGIARDIFGSEKDMVIPAQSLENEKDLIKAFEKLNQCKDTIRTHLQNFMPSYIQKAWQAGEEINKLLEK